MVAYHHSQEVLQTHTEYAVAEEDGSDFHDFKNGREKCYVFG